MFKLLKKIVSVTLVLMLVVCCAAPLANAAAAMYFADAYTEGGGDIIRQKAIFYPGETVLMRAFPYEGYTFYYWASDDVVIQNPTAEILSFVMPEKDVKISAVFAIVQDAAKNTVNVTFDTMGGSAFDDIDVVVGECVPEPQTVPTKQGFVFDGWYADAFGTLPFDFSTPITTSTFIYAKWAEIVEKTPVANEFSDVKEDDWFYPHVMSLAEKNVISGMGKNRNGEPYFAPQSNITRAQFVTILLNLAGENIYKDFNISAVFGDVSSDAWYAEAVSWAYSTGVASGTENGRFSPESFITRQDMAVMISNYVAKIVKKTLPDSVEKIEFGDSFEISEYAKASVETMQRAGIISGKHNNHGAKFFDPRAYATRAETSKMIDVLLTMI